MTFRTKLRRQGIKILLVVFKEFFFAIYWLTSAAVSGITSVHGRWMSEIL